MLKVQGSFEFKPELPHCVKQTCIITFSSASYRCFYSNPVFGADLTCDALSHERLVRMTQLHTCGQSPCLFFNFSKIVFQHIRQKKTLLAWQLFSLLLLWQLLFFLAVVRISWCGLFLMWQCWVCTYWSHQHSVCVCVFVQYQLQGNTVSDLFRRVLQVWFVKYLIFSKYPPHYSGS